MRPREIEKKEGSRKKEREKGRKQKRERGRENIFHLNPEANMKVKCVHWDFDLVVPKATKHKGKFKNFKTAYRQ